ncbi:MAG TPA: ATP-binding protein [Phycisphaerae bacterium]|nr:ATP-binding protein [Phycisphaerae bacterium]
MRYKERILSGKLRRMVERFPVVVVAGARQVGKSTLLEHVLAGWDSVVFDPAVDVGAAREDPELFLANHPSPLILDEIQYAPELVASIKRSVDRDRQPGRYVLTGSQQWSVLKSASESLAGRAVFLDLEGFCLSEVAEAACERHWLARYLADPEAFVADPPARLPSHRPVFEQLWRGFLPEADSLERDWIGEFYRAYLRTYIERDVRVLADVSDWQQFGRFVRLAAALTSQEINHSQLGRELGMTPQTAQRWLAMLKATFQWFEIPAYHGSTIKRISTKPKGFIADTGLACSLQMISTPQTLSGHPMAGALWETAVAAEIRKLSGTLATPPSLYHWRSHGGGEVDLLLERDGRLYPIEAKLASRPVRDDTRGITALRNTYPSLPIAPGLIISPAERFTRISETEYALPWDSR